MKMTFQSKLSPLQSLLSLPIDSFAALIGSIICLSFSPIFIRLSELELGSNSTAFNRFWIAAVGFGILNILGSLRKHDGGNENETKENNLKSQTGLLIADGGLLSIGSILWTWSLTQTSVANSSIIHNLIPIFTILGGFLVLGKTFDRRFLLGMWVAIAGVVLLEINDLSSLSLGQQLIGDLAALISALFFGVHPLIAEKLRTKFDAVTIMTWSSSTSALLLLPVTLLAQERFFPVSINGWLSVIALAVVGQMLGIGLWTYCLKKLSSGFASLVALIVPALSSFEGWIFFAEPLSFITMSSFLIILWGMYLAISSTSAMNTASSN